jgi:hypothetical protein
MTTDLFEEILKNTRNDRKQVEKVRDELVKLASLPEVQAESMSLVSVAENIGKLSDVLTKMNAQLVELTKVSVKSATPSDKDINPDKDEMYDAIESSGTVDVENVN